MGRPTTASKPHKVKGFWFLVRRVPAEFAPFDRRNPVRTDDPRGVRAGEAVQRLDTGLTSYWKDKRSAKDANAGARYQQACARARILGLAYAPANDAAVQ